MDQDLPRKRPADENHHGVIVARSKRGLESDLEGSQVAPTTKRIKSGQSSKIKSQTRNVQPVVHQDQNVEFNETSDRFQKVRYLWSHKSLNN